MREIPFNFKDKVLRRKGTSTKDLSYLQINIAVIDLNNGLIVVWTHRFVGVLLPTSIIANIH